MSAIKHRLEVQAMIPGGWKLITAEADMTAVHRRLAWLGITA